MPTTQTTLPPPPHRFSNLSVPDKFWQLKLQSAAPMREVDTSSGAYTEAPPAAGVNTSTGQTNQGQEITYTKISADANVFTLAGANLPQGPYTLTTEGQFFKIKSNGTVWRRSG